MQDYLHPVLDKPALDRLGTLALAHIGDGVYELLTRAHLATLGAQTARGLHRRTVQLVCAPAQARAAEVILPVLTEEEATVFRHGRNAKPGTVPRSCSPRDYAHATALEALFGFLYLRGEYDRINALYGLIAAAYTA